MLRGPDLRQSGTRKAVALLPAPAGAEPLHSIISMRLQ
jgi:hypothetical protein